MATGNSNLAYDISVYEPKTTEPVKQQQPEIKVKRNTSVQLQSAKGMFLAAILAFAAVFGILHGKVETNRLFNEMASLQSELRALEAENIALAAEYDSMTSLKNVEDYAKNTLGLQKLDRSQIEYVEFEGNQVIEIVESEKKNVFIIIRNWFANIYEYLGA